MENEITEIELNTLNCISHNLRHKWHSPIWANDLDKIIEKLNKRELNE